MALMAAEAFRGAPRLLPEALPFRRVSAGTFTALLSPADRRRGFDPADASRTGMIRVRRLLHPMASIARAPVPMAGKRRVFSSALRDARKDRVPSRPEPRSAQGGARHLA